MNKPVVIVGSSFELATPEDLQQFSSWLHSRELSHERLTIGLESPKPISAERLVEKISVEHASAFVVHSLIDLGTIASSIESLLSFVAKLSENGVRFLSFEDQLDSAGDTMGFMAQATTRISISKAQIRSLEAKRRLRNAKAHGTHIGRPKKADDDEIRRLRTAGISVSEISRRLSISRGAVEYSIRSNPEPEI